MNFVINISNIFLFLNLLLTQPHNSRIYSLITNFTAIFASTKRTNDYVQRRKLQPALNPGDYVIRLNIYRSTLGKHEFSLCMEAQPRGIYRYIPFMFTHFFCFLLFKLIRSRITSIYIFYILFHIYNFLTLIFVLIKTNLTFQCNEFE